MKADEIKLIKEAVKSDSVIIGTEESIKALRNGKVEKVFMTKKIPSSIQDEIEKFASIQKVDCIPVDVLNDELGTLCKKQFPISVLSIKKV